MWTPSCTNHQVSTNPGQLQQYLDDWMRDAQRRADEFQSSAAGLLESLRRINELGAAQADRALTGIESAETLVGLVDAALAIAANAGDPDSVLDNLRQLREGYKSGFDQAR